MYVVQCIDMNLLAARILDEADLGIGSLDCVYTKMNRREKKIVISKSKNRMDIRSRI